MPLLQSMGLWPQACKQGRHKKCSKTINGPQNECHNNPYNNSNIKFLFTFSEAKARIDSPSNKEVHVKQRSQVKLTCVVDLGSSSGSQSAAVFWYLDGQALDWLGQTGRGRGVQVTEKRGNQVFNSSSYKTIVILRLLWGRQ